MPQFFRTPFEVTSIQGENETRLMLRGELDLATVGVLTEAIDRAERSRPTLLVIDASELTFMDASGFKVLLRAARRARRAGRRLHVHNPSQAVARTLKIMALDQTHDVVVDAAPSGG